MKNQRLIEMQHLYDTNTPVPDWFVRFYGTTGFWLVAGVLCLLLLVLVVLACRLYFQAKEAQHLLEEQEQENEHLQ